MTNELLSGAQFAYRVRPATFGTLIDCLILLSGVQLSAFMFAAIVEPVSRVRPAKVEAHPIRVIKKIH